MLHVVDCRTQMLTFYYTAALYIITPPRLANGYQELQWNLLSPSSSTPVQKQQVSPTTSVLNYQTTRSHNSKDSRPHFFRVKNLNPSFFFLFTFFSSNTGFIHSFKRPSHLLGCLFNPLLTGIILPQRTVAQFLNARFADLKSIILKLLKPSYNTQQPP